VPFSHHVSVEFFAHQGNINCAVLAKWTATVFATGGDDKIIQLWRLSKAQPVLVCTLSEGFLQLSALSMSFPSIRCSFPTRH
jgi:WD40 repeat protein